MLRPIIEKDRDTLRLATFHNLNWNEERFSLEDIDSKFSHYYKNWGRTDFGFVAQRHQQVFGIIWLKYFTEIDPGFGFLDEDTPELSLCIFPKYRNCGFGTMLLRYVIEEASKRGVENLSLSVEFENDIAIKLYEKFGFRYIDGTDGTMLLDLS